MDGREFYSKVEAHPDLKLVGFSVEKGLPDAVVIRHAASLLETGLPISAILKHPWEALEPIMTGERAPQNMTHVTRIVGYWSRTKNWNKSKLAERRDRGKGRYALQEGGAGHSLALGKASPAALTIIPPRPAGAEKIVRLPTIQVEALTTEVVEHELTAVAV